MYFISIYILKYNGQKLKISISLILIWYRLQMLSLIQSPLRFFFIHGEPIHMCNEVGNNDMAITISIFFIPIFPHHIQVCPFVDNNFSISHFIGSIFIRVMLFSAFPLHLLLEISFNVVIFVLFSSIFCNGWQKVDITMRYFLLWPCNFTLRIKYHLHSKNCMWLRKISYTLLRYRI